MQPITRSEETSPSNSFIRMKNFLQQFETKSGMPEEGNEEKLLKYTLIGRVQDQV